MTALAQYQRLESGGLWKPAADAQRREVIVSFGDATLVLTDQAGRPLTHWSLPAVGRVNPGDSPALFAPDEAATETLEIDDSLMIDAIETVRRSLARRRPRQGRLRLVTRLGLVAAAGALAVLWLPGALRQQALSVVPPAARSEIGATMLGHLQAGNGAACRGSKGLAALRRLKSRVLGPESSVRLVVMPLPTDLDALALPGDLIVLDAALVARHDDPAILASYVQAAADGMVGDPPLAGVLRQAGLAETLRLLTTGALSPQTLLAAAETQANAPGIPPTAPSFVADNTASPVLEDSSWVSLQGICDT